MTLSEDLLYLLPTLIYYEWFYLFYSIICSLLLSQYNIFMNH